MCEIANRNKFAQASEPMGSYEHSVSLRPTKRRKRTHPRRQLHRRPVLKHLDQVRRDPLPIRDDLEDVLAEPIVAHEHEPMIARRVSPRVLDAPAHALASAEKVSEVLLEEKKGRTLRRGGRR